VAIVLALPACSLLYSSYDDRFAGDAATLGDASDAGPGDSATPDGAGDALLAEVDGSIAQVAVASGSVFFSLAGGPSILTLPADGGPVTTYWTADGGHVLALAGDGVSSLVWSFGESADITNSVWLVELDGGPPRVVAQARALGTLVAAGGPVSAWASGTPTCTAACVLGGMTAAAGADASSLEVPLALHPKSVRALSADPGGVDILADPPFFARFPAGGGAPCVVEGLDSVIAGLVSDGVHTFVLDGPSRGSGSVALYDLACPAGDSGVTLDQNVALLAGMPGGAVWARPSGQVFSASYTAEAGAVVGSASASVTALAAGDGYVFAATDGRLLRFPLPR
jgi:hypothetical protein